MIMFLYQGLKKKLVAHVDTGLLYHTMSFQCHLPSVAPSADLAGEKINRFNRKHKCTYAHLTQSLCFSNRGTVLGGWGAG